MRINTRLTGVDDVRRVLDQVAPRQARNIMRSTVHGMAAEIRKEARQEAPKDDGDLRKSITTKRRSIRNNLVRSDVLVKPRAYYWRFVEYGTSKMPENPFFMRAMRSFEGRVMKSFLDQFVRRFEQSLARARRNGR